MSLAYAVLLADCAATEELGRRLAGVLTIGDTVRIDGPLGAGKTSLVRAVVEGLGGDPGLVTSPTYTLCHHYSARIPIVHIDAYRLNRPSELSGLGYDEMVQDSLALIEWSERVASLLPHDSWFIWLDHVSAGGRRARIQPPGEKRLEGLGMTQMI